MTSGKRPRAGWLSPDFRAAHSGVRTVGHVVQGCCLLVASRGVGRSGDVGGADKAAPPAVSVAPGAPVADGEGAVVGAEAAYFKMSNIPVAYMRIVSSLSVWSTLSSSCFC